MKECKKIKRYQIYIGNSVIVLLYALILSTFFHSLESNRIQCEGAAALADALRVNKSLKTLK